MGTLKAIIIEDIEKARLDLHEMLSSYCPQVEVTASAETCQEALLLLRHSRPDIVFLDLTLGHVSIIELLGREDLENTQVIVVSGNESIHRNVVRPETVAYLNKPVNPLELMDAVRRAEQNFKINTTVESNRLKVSNKEGIHLLRLDNIVKLTANNNRTQIHMTGSKDPLLTSKTLKTYDFLEDHHRFCRVHHSHLVNLRHVEKYTLLDGGMITLSDGTHLSISRQNLNRFLTKIEQYVVHRS